MNVLTFADAREQLLHRMRLIVRHLDPGRQARSFSKQPASGALRRILVINLDRKPKRWQRLRRELERFRSRDGERLSSLTRRFSAIDARYLPNEIDPGELSGKYTLADQLTVHPNPALQISDETRAVEIAMTRQELAVALSHIAVWRLVANGDVPSALILEDDVVFRPGFARRLDAVWSELASRGSERSFDLLYLAYRDVGATKTKDGQQARRRTQPGLWEAAGYVLTKDGARELLARLPVHGPVDLWLNLLFEDLRVYTSRRPIIEQRINEPSTNSYSVLPVLSSVGAITKEKPLLPAAKKLAHPLIVKGRSGSGLTSTATALSMLGYRVVSDLAAMPPEDQILLVAGRASKAGYSAFVNIGSIDSQSLASLAANNPRALLIKTDDEPTPFPPHRVLRLLPETPDKWAALAEFLDLDYPSFPYPRTRDRGQRIMSAGAPVPSRKATVLRWDRSPWITAAGVSASASSFAAGVETSTPPREWRAGTPSTFWHRREDTFPSNLALFISGNAIDQDGALTLQLRKEATPVREYTGAAIASNDRYLFGSFSAVLQASDVPGTITGFFLHRNGPRQEIDIEILGKDTHTLLTNVFYNPGPEGTKLEYGYRGTPIEIDLGFDAAAAPHLYEILWTPSYIEWRVDGEAVHHRAEWGPTPIPDQPLEFNVNLWASRSVEFAGRLDEGRLPTSSIVCSVRIGPIPEIGQSSTVPEQDVDHPTTASTP